MFLKRISSKEEWENASEIAILNYPWDVQNYKPSTLVKIGYTNLGIVIGFKVKEKKLSIQYMKFNEPVYKDSCVEAFINFDPKNSENYINFEMNAIGTLLAQIGPDGAQRRFLDEEDFENIKIKTNVTSENYQDFNDFKEWSIEYLIPYILIKKYYPNFNIENIEYIACNFYKCGDNTFIKHYGTLFNVEYHKPSFHRPEFFQKIYTDKIK